MTCGKQRGPDEGGVRRRFQEGYYKKLYDIQSRVGFFHEIAKLDESVVEDVLSYPWSGAMFSDRLWQNKQALLFHVRETITQGVMQGKSIPTMSKELSARMGQSYKAAERLIRTETTYFHGESDKAPMKRPAWTNMNTSRPWTAGPVKCAPPWTGSTSN